MRGFLDSAFNKIKEFFGKMSAKDKVKLAILAAVVIVFAIVVTVLLSRTTFALLHEAESFAQAGEIYEALQEFNVPTEIVGTRIYVPQGMVDTLRIRLSGAGVLMSDELDTTLLEQVMGFTTTDFMQGTFTELDLGQRIRDQILRFDRIQRAAVIVNRAQRSPFVFSQAGTEASASVVVTVRNDQTLTRSEVEAIAGAVRGALPGIRDENISIMCSNAVLYPVGVEEELDLTELEQRTMAEVLAARIALQEHIQRQFETQVAELLVPVFGVGGVRVSATVRVDLDAVETSEVVFAPPVPGEITGIRRSASTLIERIQGEEGVGGIPGTDTNYMGMGEYPFIDLEGREDFFRYLDERNYEINELRRVIDHAPGAVTFASVGVNVNSNVTEEDLTADVRRLVAGALGLAETSVQVTAMPFNAFGESLEDLMDAQARAFREARMLELINTAIRWIAIVALGLAVILLVRKIIKGAEPELEDELLVGGDGTDEMALAGGLGINLLAGEYGDDLAPGDDLMIDENGFVVPREEIELRQTKSENLEHIEKFIENDPGAVAQLLRNWLSDDI